MTFPISINDKFELQCFIKDISKETAMQMLIQEGRIKPMMKLSECYRLLSRRKVDSAIRSGKLKCVKKGVSVFIKREYFENYISKHDFEI